MSLIIRETTPSIYENKLLMAKILLLMEKYPDITEAKTKTESLNQESEKLIALARRNHTKI